MLYNKMSKKMTKDPTKKRKKSNDEKITG